MVDTQGSTKEKVIGAISKEALLELYDRQDLVKDYTNIRERLDNPALNTRDFTALLKLVWDFILEKPKTTSEVKVNGGLSAMKDEELDSIVKKFHINDEGSHAELDKDKEEATQGS